MPIGGGVTAVDIGASGIRALRLGMRRGQLEVSGAAIIETHVQNGVDRNGAGAANAGEAAREHLREVRTNLSSLLRRGPFRSGRNVVALGGNAGLIRYLQVPPVPSWKLEMMMKYEVDEQMAASEPPAFDYRILDLPDVGGQLTIMLAMVQERTLNSLIDMTRRAGLPRGDVDLNPIGLYNAYVHGHGASASGTVMLVDIGADTIDICLVQNGSLCFARSVPGGGARLTAAVAEATGLDAAAAEKLKRERARILPAGQESAPEPGIEPEPLTVIVPEGVLDEAGSAEESAGAGDSAAGTGPAVSRAETVVSSALLREVGVLAGLLDATLMYCRAQTKQAKIRPDEVLLTGGGSMLPGIEEAMSRRLGMRVSRLEPFRKISLGGLSREDLAEVSAQAPRFAVALGLAASRVVPGSITMSLVPEAVKAHRRFLESSLWMWYAAACVFLLGLLVGYVPVRNEAMLSAEYNRRAELLAQAEKDEAEFRKLHAAAVQRGAEVRALEERVHSGRDLVQVLGLLRKATGGEFLQTVVLAEVNNRPPAVVKDAKDEERTQSFQKARRVFVRGHASVPVRGGRSSDPAAQAAANQEALELIQRYCRELGKDKLVAEARIRHYPWKPDESILEKEGVARYEFVIELVLAEPGSAVENRLAVGGGAP